MTATAAPAARRVIAKAKHDRPDGTKCRGIVVTVSGRDSEPTAPGYSRHFMTADGAEVPVIRTPRDIPEGFEGWCTDGSNGNELSYVGPCPDCGQRKMIRGQAVRGTIAPSVRCDARCEGARGPNCECSCGGANHGAGHAM